MTIRIIKSVEIFYRESDTGGQANLFTFALQKNTCLSDFMEDESIQGDLIYVVEFCDGVKKIICHPKETRNEEWQVFKLFKWSQHWYTIYEWLYKKEFKTKRPFQQYATRYEAEEARSTPEDWEIVKRFSVEEFEERIGKNEDGLNEFEELEENLDLILEYENKNSRAAIASGRYYDYFIEEWLDPKESLHALEPLILDVNYGDFWDNQKTTK
ncbi:hypothetical protein EVJ29_09630 [Exiguobacterium sp. SH4S7]|uniref:hypothetical protein n=1 Tax=Exiguobacterium sp. SH4S7 TaxID=2510958 RepID=UPI00103D1115|nr:hypothetical protein [Exiguobacterium sp. SH4S7]TCI35707.1 hypothetical protein EVJ29_09630 [Exiguobacterium sp. SH4S7]